ncbi:MAG TPA: hypothetical protein VFN25_04650, partial [Dokdonella sp.]|uniref:hypothetical protein n=1 Tax=Dokdonella sp. TaxID=2291710 RepID=UPI002D7F9730
MSRRFLAISALIAAAFMFAGLLFVDKPLVLAIHHSPYENLPFFVDGLHFLDTILGLHVWYWLAACSCISVGFIALWLSRTTRL